MDPIFEKSIGRNYMGCDFHHNKIQEPIEWKCSDCGNIVKVSKKRVF